MLSNFRKGAAVLGLALAAVPTPADAGNQHYSSAECVQENLDTNNIRYLNQWLTNYNTVRKGFVCPVVSDTTNSSTTFHVQVYDGSANEAVECRYYADGSWGAVSASGGAGVTANLNLGTATGKASGPNSVYCVLPGRSSQATESRIYEYWVTH